MFTNPRSNVAIVIPLLRRGGGAENVASWLSRVLASAGRQVAVVTFYRRENEHSAAGQRFNIAASDKLPMIIRSIVRAIKLRAIARLEKVNTLVAFTEEASVTAILTKVFGFRGRVVISVRNNPMIRGRLSRLFIRLMYPLADQIVGNSKQMAKILTQEFSLTGVTYIYNPCFLSEIQKKSAEGIPTEEEKIFQANFVFINIGRLTEQKGQDLLIKAFAKIAVKHQDAKLVILGESHLRRQLEKLIDDLKLQGSVFLLGTKENVYPYLGRSRAFVLSSLWEGMPNVLLDALASGLPVLATDCLTGPREILAPEIGLDQRVDGLYFGRYGALLPGPEKKTPAELVDELAKAMETFINDGHLNERFDSGAERVSAFAPDKIAAEWLQLLS